MKITIDTVNCSREEVQELKDYLEENCWNWKADEVEEEEEKETLYVLGEDLDYNFTINGIVLNEKIRDEQMHEYEIVERDELINNLIGWIGEGSKDSTLMRQDLEMLMNWDDEFILSSISTNAYIRQGDSEFDENCKAILTREFVTF
jgi:hypothetical protein